MPDIRRVAMQQGAIQSSLKVISGPTHNVEVYVQMFKLKGFSVVSDSDDKEFFSNVAQSDQPLPT